MATLCVVSTERAPRPLPQFSQAVEYNGMVYCSGNIGIAPTTSELVGGTVKDRTASLSFRNTVGPGADVDARDKR